MNKLLRIIALVGFASLIYAFTESYERTPPYASKQERKPVQTIDKEKEPKIQMYKQSGSRNVKSKKSISDESKRSSLENQKSIYSE